MKSSIKNIVLLALMLLSGGSGAALRPNISLADERPPIDLKSMVATAFGDWQEQLNLSNQIVDSVQKEKIDKIYDQPIARIYIDGNRKRIMLSIAYGSDQSDALTVHKPEVCYSAQGFPIHKSNIDVLSTEMGNIPVTRLVVTQGRRVEPITYWTTVGDTDVIASSVKWKLSQLKYGHTRKVYGGLLFRISSIQANENAAFRSQDDFSCALMGALTPVDKKHISCATGQGA